MSTPNDRLEGIRSRIEAARKRSPGQKVKLIAVSKTHSVDQIQAFYDLGVRTFGESYVQEWIDKKKQLPADIEWHFIGGLQSNKARFVVDEVAMIHSLDRKSLLKALARRGDGEVRVLIQIDVGEEESKGGVKREALLSFVECCLRYPAIEICGVMGLPPYREDPEEVRPFFQALADDLRRVRAHVEAIAPQRAYLVQELSMGMSHDFEVAIQEGATMIRVGTSLFGEREYL